MFCRGLVKTPTTYQLQWLAFVDVTFLVSHWFIWNLLHVKSYDNVTSDLYWHSIDSVLFVCFQPLHWVARSCTVWLTVFIAVYRYLAICKPYGNVYSHVMLHGQKYVKLIVILTIMCNFPVFIRFSLEPYEKYGQVYIRVVSPDLLIQSYEFYHMYYVYATEALVVCLPLIILCFVTVKILLELNKRQKKQSNMQTSSTPQASITAVLITILITFAICQIPYFLYWALLYNFPSLKYRCGSFRFYFQEFVDVRFLLNSAANGYVYFFMNKSFRDALFSRCECKRNDGLETIEMATIGSGMPRPRGEVQ